MHRVEHLLEVGVGRRGLGIHFVRSLQAGFHDRLRERTQLRAAGDQTLQRLRVLRVVVGLLLRHCMRQPPLPGSTGSFRQLVPLLEIDQQVVGRAAFPPAGVVVELRDLVEAELLVVIGTDPLGGVDGALLQRRIDVAAGDLLRDNAELASVLPAQPPMRILRPLKSSTVLISLLNQPPIWLPVLPGEQAL